MILFSQLHKPLKNLFVVSITEDTNRASVSFSTYSPHMMDELRYRGSK